MSNDKQIAMLNQMDCNVQVGMEEVVSVFISRYETELVDRKKDLSDKIKQAKKHREDFVKTITTSVNTDQFVLIYEPLKLSSKVESINVAWDCTDHEKSTIVVQVRVKCESDLRYGDSMSTTKTLPIDKTTIEQYFELCTDIDVLVSRLAETISLLNDVSRKERQVKGRISEMKLKSAGYESLLDNEELLKLIQL